MKTFGEILKEKRKAKGWSLEKLSAKSNVPVSTISGYETNAREPNLFIALDISNALECSVYELCGIGDKKPTNFREITRDIDTFVEWIDKTYGSIPECVPCDPRSRCLDGKKYKCNECFKEWLDKENKKQ